MGFLSCQSPNCSSRAFFSIARKLKSRKNLPVFPHLPKQGLILLKPDSLWWSPPLFRVYKLCSRYILMAHHTHVGQDRKSTRLNSSHVAISYAVFCLKKTTEQRDPPAHAIRSE